MGLENASLDLLCDEVMPLVTNFGRVVCLGVPKITVAGAEVDPWKFFVSGPDVGERYFDELQCWDISDFQGDIVRVDLNEPLPAELRGTADLLIDPGTLEHCFRVGQAMQNVVEALAVGGVVFHVNPANWIDHGFYNMCPCWYADTYEANGFTDIQVFHRAMRGPSSPVRDTLHTKDFLSLDQQLFHAVAVKAIDQPFVTPMQARYAKGLWKKERVAT